MQERINPPWSSSHPATHIWQVGASLELKLWTHRSVAPPFFNPGSYRRESISSNLLLMPPAPLEYMSYVTNELVRRLLRIVNVTEVADFNRQLFRRCVFLYLRRRQESRVGRKLTDEDGDEAVE